MFTVQTVYNPIYNMMQSAAAIPYTSCTT